MDPAPTSEPSEPSWRQPLGAGLLLGLALGCGWLAHWTPHLYPRLLLYIAAGLLALVGIGVMLTVSEQQGVLGSLRHDLEGRFAAAGIPFFTALIVLLVAALTSGNNLLYLIVSGLIAALIISGLSASLNLSGMELSFRMPEEIFAGVPASVHFQLSNAKSFWPAYSVTLSASSRHASPARDDEAPPAAAGFRSVYFGYLPHRASASAASDFAFPRRGRYTSAAFELHTSFPFGLMRKRRRFQPSAREPELLVYPAPVTGLEIPLATLRAGQRDVLPRRGDGQELYRLRPHQPGDSARAVSWKASAHTGSLYVRESAEESGLRLRLRLALPHTLTPEEAEAALSLCAGWVLALDRPDLQLEFAGENSTPGGRGLFLPLRPAPDHRRPILTYLATCDPSLPLVPQPHLTPSLPEILLPG